MTSQLFDRNVSLCAALLALLTATQARATVFDVETKITASDAAAGDHFGATVAISGDTAIVGANAADSASGSAYIFGRNEGGPGNWGEVIQLTRSMPAAGDEFGSSIAISGDTAIVGAFSGSSSGLAYIFGRNQGGPDNWGEVRKLTGFDAAAGDNFGVSVGISGDTAIVGAWADEGRAGSAYIFGKWGEVRKLTASDAAAGDEFGRSVGISGDTAIVGAWADDSNSGSAYIFGRNEGGPDNWGEVRKLTAFDRAVGDNFGFSSAISGDTAIVGAYFDDDDGGSSGSAYIFGRNQGGTDNWGEVVPKLTASDAAAGDEFGVSVGISGHTGIVGARRTDDAGDDAGSAYIFGRDQGGADNWGEVVPKLTASDAAADDFFGVSVGISGDTAIVGATHDSDDGAESGSSYIFFNKVTVSAMWNGGDGDWSDPTQWSTEPIYPDDNPGTTYDVMVNSGSAVLDVDVTVKRLRLGGDLTNPSDSGVGRTLDGIALALTGSTISAVGGDLTLGTVSSVKGFYSNGELHTNHNIVTLNDANEAVFDAAALVSIGAGKLVAPTGIIFNFGADVTGTGMIDTPNDPATPVINNGHITGNSLAEPITMSGYVKGVGTCDNCNITGTDAPGFSTAAVNRGSVSYNGTVEIEIGGTNPGGGHDQLNHILGDGVAELGGTLDIQLVNDFVPGYNDTITIMTFASRSGDFDAFSGVFVDDDLALVPIAGATDYTLTAAIPGDSDLNGMVNFADFVNVANNFNAAGTNWGQGNFDFNNLTNFADFVILANHFGEMVVSPEGAPEPGALLLWLTAGALLGVRKRRHQE